MEGVRYLSGYCISNGKKKNGKICKEIVHWVAGCRELGRGAGGAREFVQAISAKK